MDERRKCEAWATERSGVSARFDRDYPCPHPAKYRVRPRDPLTGMVDPTRHCVGGEYVCGRHVRPALMDNGDSAWWPWLVERLAPEVGEGGIGGDIA